MYRMKLELEKSIKNGEYVVYLQPKFDTQSEEIVGAEALIRKKANGQMIMPNEFLPVYEENGLIMMLDMYVLETICKLQQKWKKTNKRVLPISINESRHHLKNPNHLEELKTILQKYGTNPNLIELEMTEQTVAYDIEVAKRAEKAAHAMGFIIAMDDFGTGYSTFHILKDIEIDILKIDKCFFEDVVHNKRAQIIIQNIVEMCKKLNIKTVAEGIETKEQVEYLKRIQCDIIQGYYFAKPMSIEHFENQYLTTLK